MKKQTAVHTPLTVPVYGQIRHDGYMFRGYTTARSGKKYEMWLSPEAQAREKSPARRKRKDEYHRKWRERNREHLRQYKKAYNLRYKPSKKETKPRFSLLERAKLIFKISYLLLTNRIK